MKKGITIALITVILTVILASALYVYFNVHTFGEETRYEATCLHDGVAYSSCKICKMPLTYVTEKATGHIYTHWEIIKEPTEIENGLRESFCVTCGDETTAFVESKTNFPKVYIYGNPTNISITNFVPITFKYIENDIEYSGTAKIRLLERDTMTFAKPDYQIEFYTDTNRAEPMPITLKDDWAESNTYTLHGNYLDRTSARNYTSSVLWGEMVRSRRGSSELKKLTNGGATEGYPVIFYTNDVYKGIYTLNVDYSHTQYGIDDTAPETNAVVRAVNESEATLFLTEPVFALYNDGFKFLAPTHSPDGHKGLMQSFIDMSDFVRESSDADFRKNLDRFLDVEAACDYFIFNTLVSGGENLTNNCNFVTYDGVRWYTTPFQTYTGFGTDENGQKINADEKLIISRENGQLAVDTESVLWLRFVSNFSDRIVSRYKSLRGEILEENHVASLFADYISSIPAILYEGDIAEFSKNTSSNDYDAQNISNWYSERVKILDKTFK